MIASDGLDLAHLRTEVGEQARLDNAARIVLLRQGIIVDTNHTKRLRHRLDQLISHPKVPSMPNLLISGVPGSGKTTVINRFLLDHQRYEDPEFECTRIPVLYCEIPPDPDLGSFYNEILVRLGVPATKKLVDLRRHNAQELLQLVDAKLVVFDESQHILLAGPKMQRTLLAEMKSLSNRLCIPIVAVGTPSSASLFLPSMDPQMARRFQQDEIPELRLNQNYLRVLKGFEPRLPLRAPSNLIDREIATQLYKMCGGTIGRLARGLCDAAIAAINSGEEHITLDIVRHVMNGNIHGFEKPAA